MSTAPTSGGRFAYASELAFKDPREAAKWLRERYAEQVVKFPRTAIVISEAVYVHRNLPAAMKLTTDAEILKSA